MMMKVLKVQYVILHDFRAITALYQMVGAMGES